MNAYFCLFRKIELSEIARNCRQAPKFVVLIFGFCDLNIDIWLLLIETNLPMESRLNCCNFCKLTLFRIQTANLTCSFLSLVPFNLFTHQLKHYTLFFLSNLFIQNINIFDFFLPIFTLLIKFWFATLLSSFPYTSLLIDICFLFSVEVSCYC